MRTLLRFFINTNLYISFCAVLMVGQTNQLFLLSHHNTVFYLFVFFATLCSYNFHWYLTPLVPSASPRMAWNHRYRTLLFCMYSISLLLSLYFAWQLSDYWLPISIGVFATFLYSAPKIPHKYFSLLSKVAIGKTLFLTFVWMYVTTALPVMVADAEWTTGHTLFCISRFCLIYAICILFDYRDREPDRAQGVKSMITWMSEKNILLLFLVSLGLYAISTMALYGPAFSVFTIILLLIPGGIVLGLYHYAGKHFSDFLYYFVLDGLMMFSSLLTLLFRI
ncbi:MAG TPA: hypothetical protein PLL71_09805 [Agriterribacter sp.]|nr:hypothetical protein [Agriterribacter sp.]